MRANIHRINLLFLITVFLMIFTIPLKSLEKGSLPWFFIFKIEEKMLKESFFLEMYRSKLPSRDFIKEYGCDRQTSKRLEDFPKHLVQYVLSRLEFIGNLPTPKAYKEEMNSLEFRIAQSRSSAAC